MNTADESLTVEEFALYRYFDGGGQLLYVGITGDLAVRHADHIARSRWMCFTARSSVDRYSTLDEVREAELTAIRSEHPLFNIQDNRTAEAYERLRAYLTAVGRPDLMPKLDPPVVIGKVGVMKEPETAAEALEMLATWRELDDNRGRIMAAAKRHGATIVAIAATAGVSRPTVYKAMEEQDMTITDEEIRALWDSLDGDTEMAAVCHLAIHGEMPPADPEETGHIELSGAERARVAAMTQDQARAECERVIADTKAMAADADR